MNYTYDFDLVLPTISKVDADTNNEYRQCFEIRPLENGFGITVGNALRRVALSTLPGGAVTKIQIKGVSHEFDVLDTIVEDITSVVLAVKDLKVKIDEQNQDFVLVLEGNKKGELYASDIQCPAGVEIINKDLKIVTLAENKPFYMELTARKGIGYKLADENRGKEKKANVIYVDSIYTPVKVFSYRVEDTRVGDITNYDRLLIDIETNGTISPEEALSYSAHIMKEHMMLVENIEEAINQSQVFIESKVEVDTQIIDEADSQNAIETLDISNRAYNGLKKAGINTIEDLCNKTKKEIAAVDNIGAKTVDEIQKQLQELGYVLK